MVLQAKSAACDNGGNKAATDRRVEESELGNRKVGGTSE